MGLASSFSEEEEEEVVVEQAFYLCVEAADLAVFSSPVPPKIKRQSLPIDLVQLAHDLLSRLAQPVPGTRHNPLLCQVVDHRQAVPVDLKKPLLATGRFPEEHLFFLLLSHPDHDSEYLTIILGLPLGLVVYTSRDTKPVEVVFPEHSLFSAAPLALPR